MNYMTKLFLILLLSCSAVSVIAGETANPKVIPTPQETYWLGGNFTIGANGNLLCSVEVDDSEIDSDLLKSEMEKRISARFGIQSSSETKTKVKILFTTNPGQVSSSKKYIFGDLKDLGDEAYVLLAEGSSSSGNISIIANTKAGLWHGMVTLVQLLELDDGILSCPQIKIVDYPLMRERGLLADLGGQGYMVGQSRWNFQQWKDFIDWMVDHKLNFIHLEFIGSGKLMGNLDMEKNEWSGFPIALKQYPQLVCKDRPIRRWDPCKQQIVEDKFTSPNVENEFVGELIDYCAARGVKPYLFIGYDYFAKQLPVVMGIPQHDPTNPQTNEFYDNVLREITTRYKNAHGVVLCATEYMRAPKEWIHAIIRRTNEAYKIIRSINPDMEILSLVDYIKWQENDLEQIKLLRDNTPEDFRLVWSPHSQPQSKSWNRVFGDVMKYSNYTQYAWEHIVYIFPERIRDELHRVYADGYRSFVSQAWYFDAYSINFMAMAEYTWNLTSCPVTEFWDKALEATFGKDAAPFMLEAFKHTRFDRRLDVLSRQIIGGKIDRMMKYWDMYVTHRSIVNKYIMEDLKTDAKLSLMAAETALPLAKESSREMVEMTIISAKRRFFFASSALYLIQAREHAKYKEVQLAQEQMALALEQGQKFLEASRGLGIEYPMSVHDDEFVEKLKEFQETIIGKSKRKEKPVAGTEQQTPED